MTVKILKSISELIITLLVFIYNLSIKNSFFPDDFKTAIIKPLFKGGDHWISYLENNKLLSKHKYGFRPGLSTENALYQVTQFLYHALDSGLKTCYILRSCKGIRYYKP